MKWQNGTQEQLDAAMDNAELIPKKTYFLSNYGATEGTVVYRVDSPHNDANSTCMSNSNFICDFHSASDLLIIPEDE